MNQEEFREKEVMIWFTLSYMKGGEAELWANAYVDRAIETNDWGSWEDFLDKLARDFRSKEEPRRALEELGKLQQGKKSMAKYFLRFEQLASVVGVDVNRYPNVMLYVKRNVQHVLIDQLYQSDNPSTYQEYKRRITLMDKMRKRREMFRGAEKPTSRVPPRPKDTSAMEVDQSEKKKETRRCFICSKEGHLARNCPG
jgi:hypothetical protein